MLTPCAPIMFRPAAAESALRGHAALFLDRDGVVNVDHGYVHTPEKTEWIPGIFGLAAHARSAGLRVIVVTNQAGIARGYYSEADFIAYSHWMQGQFEARGSGLDAVYYCPHHPEAAIERYRRPCRCRKPQTGLVDAACACYGIDRPASLLVGDSASDMLCAQNAGVRGVRYAGGSLLDCVRQAVGAGPSSGDETCQ